jgi:anti-anti-sigma factor
LLAKLPHFENGPRRAYTGFFCDFFGVRNATRAAWFNRGSKGFAARRRFNAGARGLLIDDLLASAYGDGPVYADNHLVVTRTDNPAGLRLAGEIATSNSEAVGDAIRRALVGPGDPHLDVSRLAFRDVSGIRVLVDAATGLDGGRRMLLHGLPAQLEAVMRATGWTDLPALALCSCEGGER